MTVRKLSTDEICRKITPEQMQPKESDHTPIDLIGQPRAESAFKLALSSKENRFHLLVVTPNPLPLSVIERYILQEVDARKKRGETFESQDYCYLYNFREPNSPMLLTMRAGEGKRLKLLVENMIARLRREIPMAYANMQADLKKLDQELIAQTLKEGNDLLKPAREE